MISKTCSKCKEDLPIDNFSIDNHLKSGRKSQCKKCIAGWNEANKAYFANRYRKNRDALRNRMKARYIANKEEQKKKSKQRYHSIVKFRPRTEKEREQSRNQKRTEKSRRTTAIWKAANRDRLIQYWKNGRIKRMGRKNSIPGHHTEQEWTKLCERFDNRCVRCGVRGPLTRDHIVAVSKPLSSNNISNIQPLCKNCNSSKKNGPAFDYRLTPFTGKGQLILFG